MVVFVNDQNFIGLVFIAVMGLIVSFLVFAALYKVLQ